MMQPEKFHAGTSRSLGNGGGYLTFFSLPRREAAAPEAALVLKGSPLPALFAYLLAIGLLLGGGYSALSWLAAPEPVKVTANARPVRPSPAHYPQNPVTPAAPEATTVQANSVPAGDSDHVAPGSRDRSPLPAPDAKAEANEASEKGEANAPSVHSAMAEPAQDKKQDQKQDQKNEDQKNPAATAATAAPPKQESEQPAQTASTQPQAATISPSRPAASVATNTAAKTSRTPRVKLGNNSHSGKPALALMTLRTIEFPDGRRITHLIPYQGSGGAIAYDDE